MSQWQASPVTSAAWLSEADRERRFEVLTTALRAAPALPPPVLCDPTAMLGSVPVALSFHVTKVFATGEGGALVAHDPLPVTERVAPTLLGLPVAPDLAPPDVKRVAAVLREVLGPA